MGSETAGRRPRRGWWPIRLVSTASIYTTSEGFRDLNMPA
jgi:hypothetical protein